MNKLVQDLRYGVRILLKQPAFTLVAVITLALGIGANTAIFSLVNSILLQPLPFREPDQIVRMLQASPRLGLNSWGVSQADFAAYREQNRSFETLALYNSSETNLTGVAWALSVAGDTYDLGGSRLYLPNDAEGWEDDIDLGFGVYGPVGDFGHMGAGVGLENDDEVSLRATFGMKW